MTELTNYGLLHVFVICVTHISALTRFK